MSTHEYQPSGATPNDWVEEGDNFYDGRNGCIQDDTKAYACYRKAADASYHWGCHNVGKCYMEGRGVETDFQEAKNWLRKAYEKAENLWSLYLLAELGELDAAQKIYIYKRSGDFKYHLRDSDIEKFRKCTEKYTYVINTDSDRWMYINSRWRSFSSISSIVDNGSPEPLNASHGILLRISRIHYKDGDSEEISGREREKILEEWDCYNKLLK